MNVARARTCCIWRTHTADTCTRVGFIIGGFPSGGVRKSCRFQISSGSLRFVRVQTAAWYRSTTAPSTRPQRPSRGGGMLRAHHRRNPFEWLRARARLLAREQTRCNISTPRRHHPQHRNTHAQVILYTHIGRTMTRCAGVGTKTSLLLSHRCSSPHPARVRCSCVIVH